MLLSPDEFKAVVIALGVAAQDGERNANEAKARGDANEAALAGMFAERCNQLLTRLRLAPGRQLSDLNQMDAEIVAAALIARSGFHRQQSLAEKNHNERMKRASFAAAYGILAERIMEEFGRAPAAKLH